MKFTAVAFDLDGTLYPNFRFYYRLVPFLLKEHRLLRALDMARRRLRETGAYDGDFYELQAHLMAELLKKPAGEVKARVERLIYRGWEPHFKKIGLFPHVKETLDAFRDRGIKLGILSDFPPLAKLDNLNIGKYWDAVVCSEQSGRLKPDPKPFLDLSTLMKVRPEELLYVGNSVAYDVAGAFGAGMKTALVFPRWRKAPVFSVKEGESGRIRRQAPDFVFYDYRQLRDYVLN